MTWPIMLCMHELALTRSEPEAQRKAILPKPDASEVQCHITWGSVTGPLKGGSPLESQVF